MVNNQQPGPTFRRRLDRPDTGVHGNSDTADVRTIAGDLEAIVGHVVKISHAKRPVKPVDYLVQFQ